jgi:hypothetical protein
MYQYFNRPVLNELNISCIQKRNIYFLIINTKTTNYGTLVFVLN